MSRPNQASDNAAPAPAVSFSNAFFAPGRFNHASSSMNLNAPIVLSSVKQETSLEYSISALLPTACALPSYTPASQPKRSFPLLGGWGSAPAAAAPVVAAPAPTEIVVSGVPLAFPYPPYPSQVCLANQMIRAFKSRKHALLESPTGTGNSTRLLMLCFVEFTRPRRQITRHSVFQHRMAAIRKSAPQRN